MTQKKISLSLKACQVALKDLDVGLKKLSKEPAKSEYHDLLKDAVMKRFEVLFEYLWKLFKIAAEFQGSEAPGPRPAIQEAARYGWITDIEFWAEVLDVRNNSVHDYFSSAAAPELKLIEKFVEESGNAIQKVEKMMKSAN